MENRTQDKVNQKRAEKEQPDASLGNRKSTWSLVFNESTARHLLDQNGVKFTPQAPVMAYQPGKGFKIEVGSGKHLVGDESSYIVLEGSQIVVKDKETFESQYKRRYKK